MFQVGDEVIVDLGEHSFVATIEEVFMSQIPGVEEAIYGYMVSTADIPSVLVYPSELADVMIPITLICTLESLKSLDSGRVAECGCGERISNFSTLAEHLELPIARVRQYWWGRDHDRCSN